MKLRKLDVHGFSHEILLVLFVVIFAIAGIGYMVASHADGISSCDNSVLPAANVASPIYQYFNQNANDRVLTLKRCDGFFRSFGFSYENVVGYGYSNKVTGTLPLRDWTSSRLNRHLFTLSPPNGEPLGTCPDCGYVEESSSNPLFIYPTGNNSLRPLYRFANYRIGGYYYSQSWQDGATHNTPVLEGVVGYVLPSGSTSSGSHGSGSGSGVNPGSLGGSSSGSSGTSHSGSSSGTSAAQQANEALQAAQTAADTAGQASIAISGQPGIQLNATLAFHKIRGEAHSSSQQQNEPKANTDLNDIAKQASSASNAAKDAGEAVNSARTYANLANAQGAIAQMHRAQDDQTTAQKGQFFAQLDYNQINVILWVMTAGNQPASKSSNSEVQCSGNIVKKTICDITHLGSHKSLSL